MCKTIKINRQFSCREQQRGEAAIVVLVLFGLLSMLGMLNAADRKSDTKSEKTEARQTRSADQPHHEKTTSPRHLTDEKAVLRKSTPRSQPVVTDLNGNQSDKFSPTQKSPVNKPTFTPQFSQPQKRGSHRPDPRVTAEKETLPPPNLKRTPSLQTPPLDRDLKSKRIGSQETGNTVSHNKLGNSRQLKPKEASDNGAGSRIHLPDTVKRSPVEKLPKGVDGAAGNRVRLEKVPTAPKPDLKVLIPKDSNLQLNRGPADGKGLPDRMKVNLDQKLKLTDDQRQKISTQHHLDFKPNRNLKHEISRLPVEKNGRILEDNLKRLNLRQHKQPEFQTLLQQGKLLQLTHGKQAQALQLNRQFELLGKGDVARRMNLSKNLHLSGGWQHRKMGVVSAAYTTSCMSYWYPGPAHCPTYCWYPVWSPWVDWCSWDYCDPWCDPRPMYCRPVVWNPCPTWVWWECPMWESLPIVTCGTWVDVPPLVVADTDLQMLAVRFVDPGHAQQERGPRYRVWFRNNSPSTIDTGFNVMLLASDDSQLMTNRSEAGVRVDRIEAGQTMSVDIRLPEEVNYSSLDQQGNPMPFRFLSVQIDSHNELVDTFQLNNGATLPRSDVLPIDPASFASDPLGTAVGAIVNIAGEGFGPEPGQVLVQIAGVELQGEIEGWYDLGVRIRLPEMSLTSSVMANVVVIRGDGAAANPLAIEIAPVDSLAAF